jgi:hypothetical protein
MELTQTLNQKETAQLLSDFFDEFTKAVSGRFAHSKIKHIHESTGIKLDKPFFIDIHEGSFTTNALLKKYPLSTNQAMFILVLYKTRDYWSGTDEIEHCITRVYNTGRVYTDGMRHDYKRREDYLSTRAFKLPYTLDGFKNSRKSAYKTLVIVADKNNMLPRERVKHSDNYDTNKLGSLQYNPASARVNVVEECDSYYHVTLKGSNAPDPFIKKIYKSSNYLSDFVDHSGYVVGYFRDCLDRRLDTYKKSLKIKKVATTDYSLPVQKVYDEMVVLKNILANTLISTTATEHVNKINNLIYSVSRAFSEYDSFKKRLDKTVTYYNETGANTYISGIFFSDKEVMDYLETLESRLSTTRQELFDYLQQADI